jgi:hypothetical protein
MAESVAIQEFFLSAISNTGSSKLHVIATSIAHSSSTRFGMSAHENTMWMSGTSIISKFCASKILHEVLHVVISSDGKKLFTEHSNQTKVIRKLNVHALNTSSFAASTSSQAVVAHGSGLFLTDISCKMRNRVTGSESSNWMSDSALRCKTRRSHWYVIEGIVSLGSEHATFESSSADPNATSAILWRLEVVLAGILPTTGSINMNILGPTLGIQDSSLRIHLGFSAVMASKWKSDSSVETKSSSGVGFVQILIISFEGNARQQHLQDIIINLGTPVISNLIVQDNRTLFLQGSSMGVHEPQQIVTQNSIHHLRGKVPSEIAVLQASTFSKSSRVVDFRVKLVLENYSRVDGMEFFLVSPLGVKFSLINHKCKGCYKKRIEFRLSDYAPSTIPNSDCVDGHFRFDHFPVLRELLLGSEGDWKIVASAGTERDFITLSIQNEIHVQDYLGFVDTKKRAVFEEWSSDSGIAMIRGNFNSRKSIPNVIISDQIGQNQANPISVDYKPALTSVSCFRFPETGSGMITLVGYDLAQAVFVGLKTWERFDRASLSAVIKTGETSCESSTWRSQSSILCKATGRPLGEFISVSLSLASAASSYVLQLPELSDE